MRTHSGCTLEYCVFRLRPGVVNAGALHPGLCETGVKHPGMLCIQASPWNTLYSGFALNWCAVSHHHDSEKRLLIL
jgi:hypothetical protein